MSLSYYPLRLSQALIWFCLFAICVEVVIPFRPLNHVHSFSSNSMDPTNLKPDLDRDILNLVADSHHEEQLLLSEKQESEIFTGRSLEGDEDDEQYLLNQRMQQQREHQRQHDQKERLRRDYHELEPADVVPEHLHSEGELSLQDRHYDLPLYAAPEDRMSSYTLASSIAVGSLNSLLINVTNIFDTVSHSVDYCYPTTTTTTSTCSLRSAWDACVMYSSSISSCTISLPENQLLQMNVTLGALPLSSGMFVSILGNNATVQGIDNSYGQITSSTTFNGSTTSFPYQTKTLTQTNSATVNYEQACLPVCPGVKVKLSTCAGATIGDTYLKLYTAGGTMVASNDNACGSASEITYQVPRSTSLSKTGSCPIYCLRMGCSGSKTCSMTVNAFYVRPNATEPAPQFISYIAPSSPISNVAPSLTLSDFTVSSFGSLIFTGAGAINITGNASLSLTRMTFRDNQATIGAALAMVNNNHGQGGFLSVVQSQFIHNCAMSEGGSFYLSRSSVPTTMRSLFVLNNHAAYGGFISLNLNTSHVNLTDIEAISISASSSSSFLYTKKYAQDISLSYFSLVDSYSGGGGIFYVISFSSKVSIDHMTVSGATGGGTAGLYFGTNVSDITVRHTEWEGVSGTYGVMYAGTNISNVIIEDLVVYDCRLSSSGCVYMSGNITNVIIRDISMSQCINPSALSSCTYFKDTSNVIMSNIYMADAYSKSDGAFIGVNSNVKNITFQDMTLINGTTLASAPFIIGTNSSMVVLRNITMSNCLASTGGCIRMVRGNNATVQNVHLTNCTSRGTESGGGFEIYQFPNMTMTDITISHSQSRGFGGGTALDQSENVTMTRVTISDCSVPISATSGSMGGGLYVGTLTNNLTISNSTFTRCSGSLGGGIAINAYNDYVSLGGLTVTDNYASSKGGGIFIGQYNYELLLTDEDALEEVTVIESIHPYIGKAPVNGVRQVLYAKNASFANADELIVNFDQLSTVQSIDTVNIYGFVPTSTSSSVTRKTLIYSGNGDFPGVNIPSLRVPGSSIYVEFLGSYGNYVIATGLYGIRLYVYPVIRSPSSPLIVKDNVAGQKGGGIFFFYVNAFSVLTNVMVEGNRVVEGDGGGISMQIGNGGTAMQQVYFVNNTALYDGGGLVLLSGQFGISMKKCYFSDNTASAGSGGAMFLASSNGDGILLTSKNNITCTLCLFSNNTASNNGGAIYLSDENYLSINQTKFEGNEVTQGDGGAIGLGGYGTAYFQDCIMNENRAKACGGGLSAAKISSVYLTNTSISFNEAMTSGGGLCLYTGTTMTLRGRVTVEGNQAGFLGGGIASFQSPLWSIDRSHGDRLILSSNTASRGSAISFFQLQSSSNQVQNTVFEDNVATQGSTIYWIYDSVMKSEPPGLSDSSNIWINNSVLYGGEIGTQAIYLIAPPIYNVTSYGVPVDPPIEIQLKDFYHQTMTITGATTIYPTLVLGSEKCSQYPFLSGENLFGSGVAMQKGVASFDNLEIYCSPSGNVTLSFQAEVGSLTPVPQVRSTSYYIKNTTFLSFRACNAGEYETKGMCQTCPPFSYNLLDTATTSCESCHSIDGVESCEGNQIVLKEGYWRRYPTSSAVMSCLLSPSSCTGGNMTSDASCAEGYTGPLCSVCSSSYFLSGNVCLPCDGGKNEMSPTAIAVLLIVFLLLTLAAVVIYFRYGRKREVQIIDPVTGEVVMSQLESSSLELVMEWCKQKYNELMVKIKILVSTYQVIISTSTVFSVTMPVTFTKFSNSLNFLNLGFTSIFPLGCSKDFTYFDSLLWTTLIPLLICALLVVAFCVEYVYVRHKIQTNPNRQHGDKRKAFNRVKSKYLSFMFYLTYLVLPSVTTTIFQAFICTDIDPNNEDDSQYDLYLTADMSISCQSDEYYSWIPFVVAMILVYPIGIPAVYYFFLYSNQEEIRDREKIIEERIAAQKENDKDYSVSMSSSTTQSPLHSNSAVISSGAVIRRSGANKRSNKQEDGGVTFAWEQKQRDGDVESGGTFENDPDVDNNEIDEESHLSVSATRLMFLWQSYKPIYWYFELVETTRRIMLTAVLSVCSPGSSSQSVLGVLMSFLYLLYYGIHQPYATQSDFVLAEIGQLQIFFTFFSALIVQNELLSDIWMEVLGVLVTILNLSIVFITCYYEISSYREEAKVREEEAKEVRQRVLNVVAAQRKLIAEKLSKSGGGENSEGDGVGTKGKSVPVSTFRKMSAKEMMTFAQQGQESDMRPSAAGIELQDVKTSSLQKKDSNRMSNLKLDSDDESDDDHDEKGDNVGINKTISKGYSEEVDSDDEQ